MTEPSKRLYRSSTNKVIAGVCGGLGHYLDIDPVVIRVLWVFLTLFGGSGIILYIVALFVIPVDPRPAGEASHPTGPSSAAAFFGAALVIIGGLLLLDNLDFISMRHLWHRSWEYAFPTMLILAGAALLMRKRGSSDVSGTPPAQNPPAGPGGPAETPPKSEERGTQLRRSKTDRRIFGVCGGIGTFVGLDPTLIRVLYAIFTLISFGAGIVLYFLLFLLIPEEDPATLRTAGAS